MRGRPLLETERYLSRDDRRGIKKLAGEKGEIKLISDATYESATDYKESQERNRAHIRGEGETAVFGKTDVRSLTQGWWDGLDVADWVRDVVRAGVEEFGLPQEAFERTGPETVPSARHFATFWLARDEAEPG